MVAAVFLVLCVGIALCMHLAAKETGTDRQGITRWLTKRLPLESIKVVVVVWQIVTQVCGVSIICCRLNTDVSNQ